MRLEVFQLIGNEPIDNGIIKRDYTKINDQQGVNLNDSNQNVLSLYSVKTKITIRLVMLTSNSI